MNLASDVDKVTLRRKIGLYKRLLRKSKVDVQAASALCSEISNNATHAQQQSARLQDEMNELQAQALRDSKSNDLQGQGFDINTMLSVLGISQELETTALKWHAEWNELDQQLQAQQQVLANHRIREQALAERLLAAGQLAQKMSEASYEQMATENYLNRYCTNNN